MHRSVAPYVAMATVLAAGSDGHAQDPGGAPYGRLVTITVAEEPRHTLAHEITIVADAPVMARTEAQLEGRLWTATRTSERGAETIRSDACPALQTLALSFASLPPIPLRPMSARVHGAAETLAPTRKDGFATRLTFVTQTGDGSWATVEMSGGNAYAAWGHDAVTALLGCWNPLTP